MESVTSGGSGYFQKSKFNESVVRIAQNHKWPIGFLLKILNQIDLVKFRSNPEAAERLLTAMIQDTIHRTILEKVEYEFAEATVYGNGLQHEDGSPIRAMSSTVADPASSPKMADCTRRARCSGVKHNPT